MHNSVTCWRLSPRKITTLRIRPRLLRLENKAALEASCRPSKEIIMKKITPQSRYPKRKADPPYDKVTFVLLLDCPTNLRQLLSLTANKPSKLARKGQYKNPVTSEMGKAEERKWKREEKTKRVANCLHARAKVMTAQWRSVGQKAPIASNIGMLRHRAGIRPVAKNNRWI